MLQRKSFHLAGFLSCLLILLTVLPAAATTVTVQTNRLGVTPLLTGYNSGHFYKGSNTREWWRYSGVMAARLFIFADAIEYSDKIAPWGDGVTNQMSFTNLVATLRADLRANPQSTNYINWKYLNSNLRTNDLYSIAEGHYNHMIVSNVCSQMKQLGLQILVNTTASDSFFTNIVAGYSTKTGDTNWQDAWELWHRYYEEAFYLGRWFGISHYQIFNEPDGSSGVTNTSFLARVQYASDAIQSAIADVNQLYYSNSLVPVIYAPVTSTRNTGNSSYSSYGDIVVTNRHLNYLGQSNTNYFVMNRYDYHEYNDSPATFGSELASLRTTVSNAMKTETPFAMSISEFNTLTASSFTNTSDTLDTPSQYAGFGAIAAQLATNAITEAYCFKFNQTPTSGGYDAKNGMHYVDNDNAPYNVGGVTKAGEVWRLFNKAAAPGRNRLGCTSGSLDTVASYDPATQFYHVFSASDSSSAISVTNNFSAWNIPATNQILVEEVSSTCSGGVRYLTNLTSSQTLSLSHGANSVLLYTIPTRTQQPLTNIVATEDATVSDGANSTVNFNAATNLLVSNNSTDASPRNVALVKFQLPAFNPANVQLAVLTLNAKTINGASSALAHVYVITNNNWAESSVTWATTPNLLQNIPAGTEITNNFVCGVGEFTNAVNAPDSAQLAGQLVVGNTAADKMIDVTEYLQQQPAGLATLSFLLAREVRYSGDTQDGDGISIVSSEGATNSRPRLKLVLAALTPPVVTGVTNNANHTITLGFSGAAGQTYQVLASTNMALAITNWTTLLTTNLATTNWVYIDTQATNFPRRFYRAVGQ